MPSQCELDPQVAIDDVTGRLVDGDLSDPAHFGEGTGECGLLVRWVGPPIARVRDEVGWWDLGVADDPASPRPGSLDLVHLPLSTRTI